MSRLSLITAAIAATLLLAPLTLASESESTTSPTAKSRVKGEASDQSSDTPKKWRLLKKKKKIKDGDGEKASVVKTRKKKNVRGVSTSNSLASSAAMQAQTANASVTATKKAKKSTGPTFNGSLQLRHYTDVNMEGDERLAQSAKQQVRALAGTNWGSLGLLFTFIGEKKAGRPGVASLKRPYATLSYVLVTNDNLFVQPYVFALLPHKDEASRESTYDGAVGSFAEVGHAFATSAGSIRPKFNMDLAMDFAAKAPDARVQNKTGKTAAELGINGEDSGSEILIKEGQRDQTFRTRYMAGLEYKPSWAKDLKIEASVGVNQLYAPQYVIQPASVQGGGFMDVSYPALTESYNLFLLKYSLTQALSIQNEFYMTYDGFFEAERNGSNLGRQDYRQRYQNVVRMSYSL